jgi:hypothetical protein
MTDNVPIPEYLSALPDAVPAGRALVHNRVHPTRQLGMRGFRAWLSDLDPSAIEPCNCDWAPELGQHFRVRTAPIDDAAWWAAQPEPVRAAVRELLDTLHAKLTDGVSSTDVIADEYVGNPVINLAVRYVRRVSGYPNTTAAEAAALLDGWEHAHELSARERAAILARFPEAAGS